MMRQHWRIILIVAIFIVSVMGIAHAQRQVEYLDRGLVRVNQGGGNFLSWRLFGYDPEDIGFNIYRGSTKINTTPITNSTNYTDRGGSSGSTYTVRPVINGQEMAASRPSLNLSGNYLTVPVNIPSGYEANDASVGDLNGDGQYEIVLKVYPTNAQDNSKGGRTNPTMLDAYTLNGKRMWRINLGNNIRSGAHYTQFMVYDLDGDGKAEVACKTADGTQDGGGTVIGNARADYRNSNGYVLSGPEFLTVFDGQTGRALNTTNYIPARGSVSSWGDDYGNRVDRFLAAIAYLDGQRPSLIMCRGYYTRTVIAAWDFRNGRLSHRWTFDTNKGYSAYAGQGYHSLTVGDVDGDGRDEIVYGSMAVDDNGKGLWNSRLGHGDALHMTDINPNRPGLEVWGIHENADVGSALLDARTGSIIWRTGAGDVGRGVAADLTASSKGLECWGGTDGLRSATNQRAGSLPSSSNHVVWWDADLLRELLDGNHVDKYGGSRLLTANGCSSNNGTKSNPTLQADIFGDWREEVIWRTSDNRSLRIYTTTDITHFKIYTLMHDPMYRLAVAWQNVGYNQPPHPSFYLGDGMTLPAPKPDIEPPDDYYAPSTYTPPVTANPPVTAPSSGNSTYPAEDASNWGGCLVEYTNIGYNGNGYINFPVDGGFLVFDDIDGGNGGNAVVRIRYALGATESRTGTLTVNGNSQNITFAPTGGWTTWAVQEITVYLSGGNANNIQFQSTGSDLGNIDELEVIVENTQPPITQMPIVNGCNTTMALNNTATFASASVFTVCGNLILLFGPAVYVLISIALRRRRKR